MVLESAFGVQRHDIAAPSWTDDMYLDIAANVPSGTTRVQFQMMLQRLLKERLNFKTHSQSREVRGYALVVAAGGIRMKPAEIKAATGSDGDVVVSLKMAGADSVVKAESQESMDELAQYLERRIKAPVQNLTGLGGRYRVSLTYGEDLSMMRMPRVENSQRAGTETGEPPPTIFQAVQQLGLKLEPRRASTFLIFVDGVDRTPTPN
jgi:uncharacterized protein (TIGR03435 family)